MRLLLYAISAVIILSLIAFGDLNKILLTIRKLNIEIIGVLILLTAMYTVLRIHRFGILLRQKYAIRFSSLMPIYAYGIMLSHAVPARFSEPIRALLLKTEKGIPLTFSMACVFFERLSDMLVLVALSIPFFALVNAPIFILPFVAVLILVTLAVISTQSKEVYNFSTRVLMSVIEHVCNFLTAIKVKREEEIEKSICEIRKGLKSMYTQLRISKNFAYPLAISVIIWVIDGLTFYFPLVAFGYEPNFLFVLSAYALSLLIGLVTFLPGGFGSVEAALSFALSLAGIDYASAIAAVLIGRFFGLGTLILYGAAMPAFIKKEKVERIKIG